MVRQPQPRSFFGGDEMVHRLRKLPSEYFSRNCYLGSSPLRLPECQMRYQIGVDRIMWGNDFPHIEGTYPYTMEVLRFVFADVPEGEVRAMLAGNAAGVYSFDLDALQPIVDRVGPTMEEIMAPLDEVPQGSMSSVFIPAVAEQKRAAYGARAL